jgi:hypothetical protein
VECTNFGLKFIDEIVEDLDFAITLYKDKPGFADKLLTEMAALDKKADGAAFMLSFLKTKGNNFANVVQSFEDFYLSGAKFEADIKIKDPVTNEIILLEFKSWSKTTWDGLGSGSSFTQLKGYITSGNKLEYYFNKLKLIKDGVPDGLKFVQQKFQTVFKNNASEFYDLNPTFAKSFKLSDGVTFVSNKTDFIQLTNTTDFWKQLDFIKGQ